MGNEGEQLLTPGLVLLVDYYNAHKPMTAPRSLSYAALFAMLAGCAVMAAKVGGGTFFAARARM